MNIMPHQTVAHWIMGGVTYEARMVSCGKARCKKCPNGHGPYLYSQTVQKSPWTRSGYTWLYLGAIDGHEVYDLVAGQLPLDSAAVTP